MDLIEAFISNTLGNKEGIKVEKSIISEYVQLLGEHIKKV